MVSRFALSTATRFAQNREGSVAIMFGLMVVPLLVMMGVAVDYGRVVHMKSQITIAADAASLAGGRALLDNRLSDAEVVALAQTYFRDNLTAADASYGTVGTPDITVNRETGEVSVDVSAIVPMTLMKLAGFTEVNLPITSATKFDQQDVELSMALDVTGSMGGQKIKDLKAAATDLVDILLSDTNSDNKVRIALAPYASSINVGGYAASVHQSPSASNTCAVERGGAAAFTDAAPVTAGTKLGKPSSANCPSARIMPLTDDADALKSRIAGFKADGWTAGHLGVAWAWYMVSPEWSSIFTGAAKPAAYSDEKTKKYVILMTDGEFNTQYVSGNGSSSNQARNLCGEIKDSDVTVYSIAFQAPASAEDLLRDCASSPEKYFSAESGEDLRAAFSHIANQINNLRLTN
ncbi:MAG: pilus assembly protein [Hyphomicrobiaceae bacterium]|nr:pilus assembly protein [Hyphomicrobiaceae bacterium]